MRQKVTKINFEPRISSKPLIKRGERIIQIKTHKIKKKKNFDPNSKKIFPHYKKKNFKKNPKSSSRTVIGVANLHENCEGCPTKYSRE